MRRGEIVRAYLKAIEDKADASVFFAPEAVQVEMPNRLNPDGQTSDLENMRERAERGRAIIDWQRYQVESVVEDADRVAVEAIWTAALTVPIGQLAAGQTMRARFAMFFEFRGDLILRQHNYDCFDPF